MQTLEFRDSRPIYSQLADRIRQQILTGVLLPGDQLPSVREMAASCSINPTTIQRAYHELENAGWILSIPGKGSFVCEKIPSDEPEKAQMLRKFDELAAALISAGVSPMDLSARLTQMRGDHNA